MQYKNDGKSEEHYIISELIYRLFAGIASSKKNRGSCKAVRPHTA